MFVTVTAEIKFYLQGSQYLPGDKIKVTREQANRLAKLGYIKSIIKPVVDKMIKNPTRRKGI